MTMSKKAGGGEGCWHVSIIICQSHCNLLCSSPPFFPFLHPKNPSLKMVWQPARAGMTRIFVDFERETLLAKRGLGPELISANTRSKTRRGGWVNTFFSSAPPFSPSHGCVPSPRSRSQFISLCKACFWVSHISEMICERKASEEEEEKTSFLTMLVLRVQFSGDIYEEGSTPQPNSRFPGVVNSDFLEPNSVSLDMWVCRAFIQA